MEKGIGRGKRKRRGVAERELGWGLSSAKGKEGKERRGGDMWGSWVERVKRRLRYFGGEGKRAERGKKKKSSGGMRTKLGYREKSRAAFRVWEGKRRKRGGVYQKTQIQ